MVDMKRTPSEIKEETSMALSPEADEYPWGLQIHLNDEELEKLGIDLKKIGDRCDFVAQAVVTNVSQSASESDENRNMGLQITDMEIKDNTESNAQKTLYGDD